jgi:hypothetical protein
VESDKRRAVHALLERSDMKTLMLWFSNLFARLFGRAKQLPAPALAAAGAAVGSGTSAMPVAVAPDLPPLPTTAPNVTGVRVADFVRETAWD